MVDSQPPVVVQELWRYPVKSMQGESVGTAHVSATGIDGDRHWSLLDVESGKTLTARREPRLLFAAARLVGGTVHITLPDGNAARDDEALSAWLDRSVRLVAADEKSVGNYETQADEAETGDWFGWSGPEGSFHDSTRTRVSLVSRATLRDWDARRFRINVITSDQDEDRLVGTAIEIGHARLDVLKQIDRCVVTTRAQPGVERDLDVLRTINAERAAVTDDGRRGPGLLGVGCLVSQPGTFSVGDAVRLGG